ncbi:hypothetical protein P9112_004614 [Eukaryota sp. TZLM1-RC]
MSRRFLVSKREQELANLPDHLVDEEEREERRKDREFMATYRSRKSGPIIRPGTFLDICVISVTLLIIYLIIKAGL